MLANLR